MTRLASLSTAIAIALAEALLCGSAGADEPLRPGPPEAQPERAPEGWWLPRPRPQPVRPEPCAAAGDEAPHEQAKPKEPRSRWTRRPFALEAITGIAGPYGNVALALDISISDYLAFNAGVGRGWTGYQYGITPRVRLPLTNSVAMSLEAGLSAGEYKDGVTCFMCEGDARHWDRAVWFNAGLNAEGLLDGGFHWRVFAGDGFLLNQADYTGCSTPGPTGCDYVEKDPFHVFYMGGAAGYALSL